MLIEQVKSKIACEILSSYVSSLPNCQSLEELKTPTQKMLQQVVALAMPKYQI